MTAKLQNNIQIQLCTEVSPKLPWREVGSCHSVTEPSQAPSSSRSWGAWGDQAQLLDSDPSIIWRVMVTSGSTAHTGGCGGRGAAA